MSAPAPSPDRFRARHAVALALLLPLAAWAGVSAARRWVLPHSPPRKEAVAPGFTLEIAGPGPLYAGRERKALREFLFARENGISLERALKSGAVFELPPPVTVRAIRSDADLVEAEIVSGPKAGSRVWLNTDAFKKR